MSRKKRKKAYAKIEIELLCLGCHKHGIFEYIFDTQEIFCDWYAEFLTNRLTHPCPACGKSRAILFGKPDEEDGPILSNEETSK